MKIIIKNIKINGLASAVIYTLFGLFLVLLPEFAANIIGWLLGGALLIMGIFKLINFFVESEVFMWYRFDFILGMTETLAGLFILVRPGVVAASIPFIFGIILFIHGVAGIAPALDMKRFYPESSGWIFSLILAIGSMLLGFIVFNNPFGAAALTFRIIGVCLIYSGISDFINLFRSRKAFKTSKSSFVRRNADGSIDGYIDADYRDIR